MTGLVLKDRSMGNQKQKSFRIGSSMTVTRV